MGRYYYDKKDVTEDYLRLSIAKLREWGYLTPNQFRSGSVSWTRGYSDSKSSISISVSTYPDDMYIRLWYTNTDSYSGEKKSFDYQVPLTTTPCNFGGERYWFICPLNKSGVYCGKRVGRLYGGSWFGCRHCYNLSYTSRNESGMFRGYPFKVLTNYKKIEDLEATMKRRIYNGKPTKTYNKILKLQHQVLALDDSKAAWQEVEEKLLKPLQKQ